MDFNKAKRLMIEEGKKIRRKGWSNKDFSLPVSKEESEEKVPYLTIEDIDAKDWEVYGKRKFCKSCGQEIDQ